MWADAQRDGRPAPEIVCIVYQSRRRPNIVQSLVGLRRTTSRYSNEVKTRNPLKFAGVPQTPEPIAADSEPKFAVL